MTTDKDKDKDKRGFEGLASLFSDLSAEVGTVEIAQTKSQPTEATTPSSTPLDPPKSGRVPKDATPRSQPTPPTAGGAASTNWWPIVFGAAVLAAFGMGLLVERGRNMSLTVGTTPSTASGVSPGVSEDRPGVGTDILLSPNQLNYCLAEAIRLEGMRAAVGPDNSQIDAYNAAVADSNSRCGSYRYDESALQAARSRVERIRTDLLIEGRSRLLAGHPALPAALPQIAPLPILEAKPLAVEDHRATNPHTAPEYPPLRPAEIYRSFRSGVDALRVFAADDVVSLDKMTLTADQQMGVAALIATATSDANYTTAEAYGIDINGDQALELVLTKNSGGTVNIQDADVYQFRSEAPTVRPMFQFPPGLGHASFLRFDGRPGLHVASTIQGFRYRFGPGVDAVYSSTVSKVDGLGLLDAPEIMRNPIAVFCAGLVARVSALDAAQCLSAWDASQQELLSKFDWARRNRTKKAGASKDWDNLMVAASHLLEPLVNSGHHEQADAYLQKIWPSDDQTSLREFRNRYWGAIDKAVLAGEVSE